MDNSSLTTIYDAAIEVAKWLKNCLDTRAASHEVIQSVLGDPGRLNAVLRTEEDRPGTLLDRWAITETCSALQSVEPENPDILTAIRRHYQNLTAIPDTAWRCGWCGMENSSAILVCTNCGR